jgi:capsular exopolysaccharide synthesis family protein
MSRVHDAMRRAGQMPEGDITSVAEPVPPAPEANGQFRNGVAAVAAHPTSLNLPSLLSKLEEHPFNPAPESHLIDLHRPMETPSEEFRSLRTKLNYMQTLQSLHTVVVTSASPAEGKSFTAMNLALAESHLAENTVLVADFDLRRPTLHNLLQLDRSPGISDYLMGEAPLEKVIKRITGSNLYFMPAGKPVKNPLELLNLREVKVLLDELHTAFNWTFFDTPPLLFSADANLIAAITDGTILVVRIGSTTIDTIARAVQSLNENNVLGVVANGARAGELYSKYTYYYSKKEEA